MYDKIWTKSSRVPKLLHSTVQMCLHKHCCYTCILYIIYVYVGLESYSVCFKACFHNEKAFRIIINASCFLQRGLMHTGDKKKALGHFDAD